MSDLSSKPAYTDTSVVHSTITDTLRVQCTIEDHDDQPLNMVCLYKDCPRKGLICVNCLTNDHYDHMKYCISLKVFIDGLQASIATSKDFKKQEDQLSMVNSKFNEIFHELKIAKDDFEDCFNRLEATFSYFHNHINEHIQHHQLDYLKESLKKLEEKSYGSIKELDYHTKLLIEHTQYSRDNPKHFHISPMREKILLLRKNHEDLTTGLSKLKEFLDPIITSLTQAPIFQEFNQSFDEISLDSYRSDRSHNASQVHFDNAVHSPIGDVSKTSTDKHRQYENTENILEQMGINNDKHHRESHISQSKDLPESNFSNKRKKSKAAQNLSEAESDPKRLKHLRKSMDVHGIDKPKNVGLGMGGSYVIPSDLERQIKKMDISNSSPVEKDSNSSGQYRRYQSAAGDMSHYQLLAAAKYKEQLENFDPRKLKCTMTIVERSSCQINTIILLNDNKTILTGNNKGQVNAWNYQTGEFIKAVAVLESDVCAMTALHDGERFAVACTNGDLEIYDYYSEQWLLTLKENEPCLTTLVYLDDFTTLASGGQGACIQFWDINSGQEIAKIEKAHKEWIWSLVYLNDGESIVSSGGDGVIKIWNYKTQKLIRILSDLGSFIFCSTFIKARNWLAFGDYNGIIRILDAETGDLVYNLIGHKGRISSLSAMGEGEYLASGSEDKTIRIWGLRNGSHLSKLSGHLMKVSTVATLEDQVSLVTNSWDKTIKVWSMTSYNHSIKVKESM